MIFKLLLAIPFVLIPSAAFAWGPMTHMYLGSEVFYLASALPTAVYALIKKYRQDFLYGNIMADTILAKKYLPRGRSSHCWEVAIELLESAGRRSERAFSLGYMSHLAADTVAHGRYTAGRRDLEHALLELRADRAIDTAYWYKAIAIAEKVQDRNDAFLERNLERVVFSFKTNRRIFKGVVALSFFNKEVFQNPFSRKGSEACGRGYIEGLHRESLDRMADVLQNGARSEVLKESPRGAFKRGRVLGLILA